MRALFRYRSSLVISATFATIFLSSGFFPLISAHRAVGKSHQTSARNSSSPFTYELGAITRADRNERRLSLVFSGDEFGEGATLIARELKARKVKASFFLTGRFYRNQKFADVIRKLLKDGHYLGPHSDEHPLYCEWDHREKLLVTREEFDRDLDRNYESMKSFGIRPVEAAFFLPPYEWYNQSISDWTNQRHLRLINFTPGTRSNADYTTPDSKNYVDSKTILASIKGYEAKDPAGLNGFILLMHIGTDAARTDKLYNHLDELIAWLKTKHYELVRLDDLLRVA